MKRILVLNSVAARIESCRQDLVRVSSRQHEARETKTLAHAALETAGAEVTSLSRNSLALEASVHESSHRNPKPTLLRSSETGWRPFSRMWEPSACVANSFLELARACRSTAHCTPPSQRSLQRGYRNTLRLHQFMPIQE